MHAIKVIDKATLQKSRAKQKVPSSYIILASFLNKNTQDTSS
jgi:hypothetical protein